MNVQPGCSAPVQKTSHGNIVPEILSVFEVFNPKEASTNSSLEDAVTTAINFFASNAQVPVESITLSSSHKTARTGITQVYLQQVINGLEVSNGVGNVNIDKNGQIISVGKSFYTGPVPAKEDNLFHPKLCPTDAVEALGKNLNLFNTGKIIETESKNNIGTPGFTVSGVSFAVKEIPAILKYIQVNSASHLCLVWSLEVSTENRMYNAFVDANNGEIVGLVDYLNH